MIALVTKTDISWPAASAATSASAFTLEGIRICNFAVGSARRFIVSAFCNVHV
jgi:hypothetical protein